MIKLNKDYSDYTDETDPNYPEGKAVNASTGDSVDGTPILASLVNNTIGAFQAMYKKAYGNTEGINGVEDNVNNSQFVDAVVRFTDDEIYNLGKCVLCTTEASNLNKVVLSEVVPRFSLKNGVVIKVIFQEGAKKETKSITTSDVVTLNYCNTGAKKIFARKDGEVIVLGNKVIGSDSVFFQELTDLNLIYLKDLDGGNGGWLIMGNPVLISNSSETSGFLYYADGTSVYNKQSVYTKSESDTAFQAKGSYVPTTRTVNGKALSSNITLGQNDIKLSTNKTLASHESTSEKTITIESLANYSYISLENSYGTTIYASAAIPIYILKTIKQFIVQDDSGRFGVKYNSDTSVTLWTSYSGRKVTLRAYK